MIIDNGQLTIMVFPSGIAFMNPFGGDAYCQFSIFNDHKIRKVRKMIFVQTAKNFAADQNWKTADILCVFQGFSTEALWERFATLPKTIFDDDFK